MNLNLLNTKFIILILIIGAHGGIVDDVYGKIKDTASGLRQDVRNVWNYGKGIVGLSDPKQEHKDGLIGSKIHSIRHTVHEIWHVDQIPNDSGLLWNMYNRFKQRLGNAKNYVLQDDKESVETTTKVQDPETKLIHATMKKLFNDDGTTKLEGKAFDDIVDNLRGQLKALHPEVNNTDDNKHSDKENNDSVVLSVPSYIHNKMVDSVPKDTEITTVTVGDNIKEDDSKTSGGIVGLNDVKVKQEIVLNGSLR